MARPPRTRGGSYRPAWLRLGVLALALVAIYATMAGTGHTTPKLGLDLEGGTTVTLNPRLASGKGKVDSGAIDQAVDVIRNRVNGLGVAEADVRRAGNRIEISVPGKGREQVLNLVGSTAELRFRQVLTLESGTATAGNTPTTPPTPTGTPSASGSATGSATPAPSASATTKSTTSSTPTGTPTASPTASKRVLSQGLLAASGTPTPAASATPSATGSAGAAPAASATPSGAPSAAVPTSPAQCASLSHKGTSSTPSAYTVCMYETVKCPSYKPDTATEKATDFIVACQRDDSVKYLLYPARLVGTDVKGATATVDSSTTSTGQWLVDVSFTGGGQKKFTQLSKDTLNATSTAEPGGHRARRGRGERTGDAERHPRRRPDQRQLLPEGSHRPGQRAEVRRAAAGLRP